jgi:hypothetical protein
MTMTTTIKRKISTTTPSPNVRVSTKKVRTKGVESREGREKRGKAEDRGKRGQRGGAYREGEVSEQLGGSEGQGVHILCSCGVYLQGRGCEGSEEGLDKGREGGGVREGGSKG